MATRKSSPSAKSQCSRFIALLRGINVGGKNLLPMKALVQMFVDAGCTNVRKYIQSGNVVFDTPVGSEQRVSSAIVKQIALDHGLRVPVIIRSADDIEAITKSNPYLEVGDDEASLHVVFLKDAPDRKRSAVLDPHRSPGDAFTLRGREIYVRLRNGVAQSKLTNAYFDSTLATTSTMRNWRTVLKLLSMVREE